MSENRSRKLRDILDDIIQSDGINRVVRMQEIRNYVKNKSPEQILSEIRGIHDEVSLNLLLGAGMKGIYYHEICKGKAEIYKYQ